MIESSARGPLPFFRALIAALACVAALAAGYMLSNGAPAPAHSDHVSAASSDGYGNLPLSFEPSAGRYDGVDFLSNSSAGTVAVGPDGLRFVQAYGSQRHPLSAAIGLELQGATLEDATGADRLPGVVNDLRGRPADHVTGIPTFGRVAYEQAWPGVDLVLHGRTGAPEYDFRLAPGADPAQISMRVAGADRIAIDRAGALVIHSGGAVFRQHAPVAFQPGPAGRTPVDAGFVLGGDTISFRLGAYDPDRPLVIDPVTVSYSTYLGGSGFDAGTDIAVDGAGAAYVIGQTSSTDFDTAAPFQGTGTGSDAFISKINPAGSALVYSTYLGGAGGSDYGTEIAVDAAGAAYATGTTGSSDFPTTAGAFQTVFGGLSDAFAVKLNPAGSALVYSTFLGGAGAERASAQALDATGAVYIGGDAGAAFPTTVGAFQSTLSGSGDAFVTKLNASGSALVYSTYLGGGGSDDVVSGLAVDGDGGAYATGFTNSTDFPTLTPIQGNQPGYDGFVTKLNPAGTALDYSTYLGGDGLDNFSGIAVDGDEAAYVVGYTQSSDFPTVDEIENDSPGADGFIAKLGPSGSALDYSTYLGGSGFDWLTSVTLDADDSAWVGGHSDSADFDTLHPIEGDSPGYDGVLLNLGASGSLRFSTYIGGDGDDVPNAIALGADGVYMTGYTQSSDYDTVGQIEGDSPSADVFVTKFSLDTAAPQTAIDSGPPNGSTITDRTPTFGFSADEDGSTFECSIVPAGQPAAFGPCSGPGATHTPGSDLADGGYVFAVRATDAFGNVDASPAATLFTVASPAVMPSCLGQTATVVTTDGDDDVTGTEAADVVVGGKGDDVLRGLGGDDLLCGRSGDDRLLGGKGADRLRGGVTDGSKDRDVIRGGRGDDRIFGFAGDEKLAGGRGGDTIKGGGGKDQLRGGNGVDDLRGGAGRDKLDGGPERDICVGGGGRDRLRNCEDRPISGEPGEPPAP